MNGRSMLAHIEWLYRGLYLDCFCPRGRLLCYLLLVRLLPSPLSHSQDNRGPGEWSERQARKIAQASWAEPKASCIELHLSVAQS